MRSTFALVDLKKLKRNFLNIQEHVNGSKVMAVVKADAYGHGVKDVVEALLSLNNKAPHYFGVAIIEEALELINYKIKTPILIFDPLNKEQSKLAVSNSLHATVFTKNHINNLLLYQDQSKHINVHIKVDTGMNRLGIGYKDVVNFVKIVKKSDKIKIAGIYTHFATSDSEDKTFAYEQLDRFKEVLAALKENNLDYGLAHCANSGAIADMPESYFDMVRPGIALYGYYPSLETSKPIKLSSILSLHSVISSVKKVLPGESVSYSRRFFADKELNIASIPIGYADGYNRGLTNKSKIIIKHKYFDQVGTVTMDRIMVNIKDEMLKPGDKVLLLGKNGKFNFDAWEWSKLLNTIPYEVLCNISKRVPRIYNK